MSKVVMEDKLTELGLQPIPGLANKKVEFACIALDLAVGAFYRVSVDLSCARFSHKLMFVLNKGVVKSSGKKSSIPPPPICFNMCSLFSSLLNVFGQGLFSPVGDGVGGKV